jgi:hypothetical protein
MSAVIAPGTLELDQASVMLQIGEYSNDEITIGISDLSNRILLSDRGAITRTAMRSIVAAPHARMSTIVIGFIVSAA